MAKASESVLNRQALMGRHPDGVRMHNGARGSLLVDSGSATQGRPRRKSLPGWKAREGCSWKETAAAWS